MHQKSHPSERQSHHKKGSEKIRANGFSPIGRSAHDAHRHIEQNADKGNGQHTRERDGRAIIPQHYSSTKRDTDADKRKFR